VLGAARAEHRRETVMSRRARRAAVAPPARPPGGVDARLERGTGGRGGKGKLEIAGSVARLAGWRPAFDARTSDLRETLTRRLVEARWQVPTLGELGREFPGAPIRGLLARLAREGGDEPIDQERYETRSARSAW